ncbi:hydroxyacylglutathione hydrolase [Escherichia coli]|uniref:hydroxyacylglutathione hydrolase C-terminal domain-containing protein n=1 Tax=Escherichia coli TaxID=562 RepID=UPI001F498A23|nr:hydroxyacylglutathione hydrolase C-terminal domain-containing protein [Escherichia coli]MCH6815381.1 hydroxyacylglutathione hydrolase [Escherichia coli]
MNLNSIPAFDDNYIWVLNDEAGRCLIVDPGDAEPVLNAIAANNWQPEAIFLTHHHHDHVGGVKELVGGCGRLFEGTASQMYQSLKKLSALPDDTLVCCAHEYTLSNMKFALSILPHDLSINDYYRKVKELRAKNQITLPVILKNERQINVFLRTEDIDLINVINEETLLQQPEERFAWLRSKKDRF